MCLEDDVAQSQRTSFGRTAYRSPPDVFAVQRMRLDSVCNRSVLVAEYLVGRYGVDRDLSWAMAGRSQTKLEAVRDEIGAPPRLKRRQLAPSRLTTRVNDVGVLRAVCWPTGPARAGIMRLRRNRPRITPMSSRIAPRSPAARHS